MSSRSMTPREWTSVYEVTKKDLQRKFVERCTISSEEIQSIERVITSLETQLKIFAAYPIEYDISSSEIGRREVIVKGLVELLRTVRRDTYPVGAIATPNDAKRNLFGSSSQVAPPKVENSRNANQSAASNQAQRQQEILKMQDEMLLDISAGVDRLHSQATTIGDEAKLQVRLLDGIDEDVESVTGALKSESKHTERIKTRIQVSWMYSCIAIEVIIIVILLIIVISSLR